jgi:TolA-binding protein
MLRWFGLCALPLLAGGCAQFELLHAEIQAARGEIAVVNRKVDSTRSDVQAVNQRLSQVGLKSGDEVSRTRADLQVSISQLMAEMQKIQGQLEANQQRMTEIDRHLAQLKSARPVQKSSPGDTGKPVSYGNPLESSMQTAQEDFSRGRYDLAYRGFSEVATRDSSGTLAPLALFKMGECRFAQSNWDEARTLYQKLLRDYSKDAQRCAAFFKLGLAYERQGGLSERDEAWSKLQKSCPGSNEAQRAKEQQAAGN